jgi:hypothetical protein
MLCAFYLVTKPFVRYWLFRPTETRPGFVRHVEALRVLDLAATLALIGAFFLLLNSYNIPRTIVLAIVLLIYDLAVRYVCLQLEVRRLLASSSKWTYRTAVRQVRRRARGSMAR